MGNLISFSLIVKYTRISCDRSIIGFEKFINLILQIRVFDKRDMSLASHKYMNITEKK